MRSELSVRLTGPPEVARLLVPEAVNDWSSVVFRLTAIDVVMTDRIASSPIPFLILSLPVPISQVRKIFRSPISRHLQDEQIKVELPSLRSKYYYILDSEMQSLNSKSSKSRQSMFLQELVESFPSVAQFNTYAECFKLILPSVK